MNAAGAAGDLHAGRRPAGRALRDRAHRDCLQYASDDHGAANDWLEATRNGRDGSAPRTCSSARSRGRAIQAAPAGRGWRVARARLRATFRLGRPPVLNPDTRLAVRRCPARSFLRVMGYELAGGEMPSPRPCYARFLQGEASPLAGIRNVTPVSSPRKRGPSVLAKELGSRFRGSDRVAKTSSPPPPGRPPTKPAASHARRRRSRSRP